MAKYFDGFLSEEIDLDDKEIRNMDDMEPTDKEIEKLDDVVEDRDTMILDIMNVCEEAEINSSLDVLSDIADIVGIQKKSLDDSGDEDTWDAITVSDIHKAIDKMKDEEVLRVHDEMHSNGII